MWEFETEVSKIIQRTPSIRSFRFPIRATDVSYEAGQFFFVTIKVDGDDDIHHFSLSSSPTERGYLEFTKRITQSAYSQALARMKPGDWARLRGPFGGFTLPPEPGKVGFLTGGIGITPLRAMLRYIADKGLSFDVTMLYGNHSWEEICFRDELERLHRELPHFRLEHALAEPPPDWKGARGLINGEIIRQFIPDYHERLFYISGPPRMVLSLGDQARNIGVPDDQIKRDSFTGYD
ncbi:MAG: FAD-dependent oxidoreductase [Chloroflexi bacterium]|nr:FAD-dependent oxidoreductase [Chloroflexota bacterium]